MTKTDQINMRMRPETRAQLEELRQRLERWHHALADSEAAAAKKFGFQTSIKRRRASNADVVRFALNSLEAGLSEMEAGLAAMNAVILADDGKGVA